MESRNAARRPRGWLRALAHDVLWRCAEGFHRAAAACLYLAAGLLRRNELRASSEAEWNDYNASADDVDLGLEASERRFYTKHLRGGDRVLLVGCGTGRDLVALLAEGFDVTGLDQSPALIEQAKAHLARKGLTAPLLAAPIETAELEGRYDAVLLATSYSCIPGSATRIAALSRIRAHLAPGGRVLLAYAAFTHQSSVYFWLMRAGAWLSGADWSPERGDVFSRAHNAPRLLSYAHRAQPDEVAGECAAAGLRLVEDQMVGSSTHYAVAVAE